MAHLQKHKHFVPQFVHFHQTFQNNEIFNSKYETNRLLYLSVKCQCGFFQTAFQKIVTFNSKYDTNKPKPQAKPTSIPYVMQRMKLLEKEQMAIYSAAEFRIQFVPGVQLQWLLAAKRTKNYNRHQYYFATN